MMHAEFLEFLQVSAVALVLFFIFCGFPGSKHLNQSCLSVWRPVNETSPLRQQHKGPWQASITLWLCQPLLKLGIWRYKQLIISRENAFACGFFISVRDVTFRVAQTDVRAVTKSSFVKAIWLVIITLSHCLIRGSIVLCGRHRWLFFFLTVIRSNSGFWMHLFLVFLICFSNSFFHSSGFLVYPVPCFCSLLACTHT